MEIRNEDVGFASFADCRCESVHIADDRLQMEGLSLIEANGGTRRLWARLQEEFRRTDRLERDGLNRPFKRTRALKQRVDRIEHLITKLFRTAGL